MSKIKSFFSKHYWLLLLLLVLISYGQILGMYVWQDDNGLFFKLAHINEKAGYLGPGPFGDGAYKYIHTPYIPIYNLFGFNTVAYFVFTLIIYFLTTIVVYKVFSRIFGGSAGKLAGFLYATGYIASDGFIRLFNSVITSVSIGFICVMFLSYWKFFKERQWIWYLLSVLFFFLSIEFARGRTHYLIAVVISFELLFLAFEKPIKSIVYSLIRLLPFVFIFYQYFIVSADQRSNQVKNLVVALYRGEFYQLYSFIASFLNVVIPDWVTRFILSLNLNLNSLSWVGVLLNLGLVTLLLWKHSYKNILLPIFYLLILTWKLVVNDLFSTQVFNLSLSQIFSVYLGGSIFLLVLASLIAIEKYRKVYLFMFLWAMLNIAAYAAYNPTIAYESVNRYLAHSFFAWIGVLLIFFLASPKRFKKVLLMIIIFWGIGNLIASVFYQNNILRNRSNPPREFYRQLKEYVPTVKKGDIFYFDVSDESLKYFDDAFSVASMPETTAIAWRYGVDRYDITRFTDFKEFARFVNSEKVSPDKIHAFWYGNQRLIDTSDFVRKTLFEITSSQSIPFEQDQQTITFKSDVLSTIPLEVSLDVQATALGVRNMTFPYQDSSTTSNEIHHDPKLKQLAVNYFKAKQEILNKSQFYSTSWWRERTLANLHDKNPETFWQADRVLWQKRNESITLDIGSAQSVDRLVWINGFANNTPTKYQVEVSVDGVNWKVVREINLVRRVDNKEPQVIEFDPVDARYFKMKINETIGGDSPTVAEAWVVPTEFEKLNIVEAESFTQHPFSYVDSPEDYDSLLRLLGNSGFAQIYYLTDKKKDWQTDSSSKVNMVFDGRLQTVKIKIPAGGTKIDKIKLILQIPGTIVVRKVNIRYLNLNENINP